MAYSNYLYHHGIKGQKWGIRRFQNPDGTLTSEGKKRYGVNEKGWVTAAGANQMREDALTEVDNYKKSLMDKGYSKKKATKIAEKWADDELMNDEPTMNVLKQARIEKAYTTGRLIAAQYMASLGEEVTLGVTSDGKVVMGSSAKELTENGAKVVNSMDDIMNYVDLRNVKYD